MLIGLATLISILFFGGVSESFLVDKLEKGVKQYVVDKERKKEIAADLKESKKFIKAFNKERKSDFKSFKKINANRETSELDMKTFFEDLMSERLAFQDKVIDTRLTVLEKIKEDEWDSIIELAGKSVDKKKEKQQKKLDKAKASEPFGKTYATIDKMIVDSDRRGEVKKTLKVFIDAQVQTNQKLASMNVADNSIVNKKDATKKELKQMASELNKLRYLSFQNLITFHMNTKAFTNQAEWDKILKSFNKELNITSH